jgi:hypothetical protein
MDQPTDDLSPAPTSINVAGISGESLMAVTGIQRLFVAKPGRITMSDKDAAERLPRDISRACRAFLDEDHEAEKIPASKAFDYMKALDQITEAGKLFPDPQEQDPGDPFDKSTQLEVIASMFRDGDNELALAYMDVAKRIVGYLQSILPIRTEQLNVMLMPKNVDPSDTEIARFRRAWDIAEDPKVVMRDMDRGILVSDQITHLEAMYGETLGSIRNTMKVELGNALARKKSLKIGWKKNQQVEVLYATSTFSPALAAALQNNFKDQGKPQSGPPPVSNPSKAAAKVQTSVGAIADGSAS